MLNLNKIVVAFAITLLFTICGCATHNLPLSRSEAHIRTAVLKITPLGTPIDETATLIKRKFHPETFYHFDKTTGGMKILSKWPLGGGNIEKVIGCQIGVYGNFVLNPIKVDVSWAFDKEDRLIDVSVFKTSNL